MIAVPADTPVTIPVVPTLAEPEPSVSLQLPPAVASLSVIVEPPAHTTEPPLIAAGYAFTVTITIERQPVGIR